MIPIAPLLITPLLCSALPPPQDSRLPVFDFPGHEERAALLTDYLRHHFESRKGIAPTLFNKEYLTIADAWMDGAGEPRGERSVQELYAQYLLGAKIDAGGYVSTHQHFSHAHDDGWPFPLWPQMIGSYEGITYGWHFQDSGPGWVWSMGWLTDRSPNTGERAIRGWGIEGAESRGIREGSWRLLTTARRVELATPPGVRIDAFNAPFLQIRWRVGEGVDLSGTSARLEWQRAGEEDFEAGRGVEFDPPTGARSRRTGMVHALVPMYRHAEWTGGIERFRLVLDSVPAETELAVDSIFTVYDTRHPINDPILILASWNLFRWTGDLDFLRRNIDRMRTALRYQQTEMGGLEFRHIRNRWPGHDGLSGWVRLADGTKEARPGHGIGNNYFDLVPFGWDDCYSTAQYHASLVVMAELEEAIAKHAEWKVPAGDHALDPAALRAHAAEVRVHANELFWSEGTGRFVACFDVEGNAHDYGYTFLGLEAIHYGLASEKHAAALLEWISGERIVEGDTSTGADIYRWRFGPRVSTRRNVDWYGQGWTNPESIPFGGQIQDGGAVLGFAYHDLMARIRVRGADDCWERLGALLDWEAEVRAAGGYRAYYEGGARGTTLQGCGTAGGLGVDCEFLESSLVPAIVIHGFLGLDPRADRLRIRPRLPAACPEMAVSGLLYRGVRIDLRVTGEAVELFLHSRPAEPLRVEVAEPVVLKEAGRHRISLGPR